jgi:hypothetical protein
MMEHFSMTNWAFEVGKQVVCIIDLSLMRGSLLYPSHFVWPVYKGIYTLRVVRMQNDWGFPDRESLSLGLEGIVNIFNGTDCLFHSSGFRPVKNTSIECFKKLLNPLPQKELI